MKFDVIEQPEYIRVWLSGPDPWQPQTFFPVIDKLLELIRESLENGRKKILFDFRDINFIDSYMISMLVSSCRFTNPERNVLIAPDEQVRSILQMLGIDRMIDVYETMEEWKSA